MEKGGSRSWTSEVYGMKALAAPGFPTVWRKKGSPLPIAMFQATRKVALSSIQASASAVPLKASRLALSAQHCKIWIGQSSYPKRKGALSSSRRTNCASEYSRAPSSGGDVLAFHDRPSDSCSGSLGKRKHPVLIGAATSA